MVQDVEEGARDGQGMSDAQADHDVADLADAGVGQHAFDIVLEVGENRAEGHGYDPQDDEDALDLGRPGVEVEEDADQGVDTGHLDHHAGKDGRNRGRGRGVGVRKPGVEGHDGRLQAKTREEHGADQQEQPRHVALAEKALDGAEFQGSEPEVDQSQPDQDQGGSDHRQQQVFEGGFNAIEFEGEGHQHIGSDGGHLHVEIHAEEVVHQDYAVEAQHQDEEEPIELGAPAQMIQVVRGIDQAREADGIDHQQKERAKAVGSQAHLIRREITGRYPAQDQSQAETEEDEASQHRQAVDHSAMHLRGEGHQQGRHERNREKPGNVRH